jgi:hypothetical protein
MAACDKLLKLLVPLLVVLVVAKLILSFPKKALITEGAAPPAVA